jgi:hypothetical protein
MKFRHATEALLEIPYGEAIQFFIPFLKEPPEDLTGTVVEREITGCEINPTTHEIISKEGGDSTTYTLTAIGRRQTMFQARGVWETDTDLSLEDQTRAAEVAFHLWEAAFESHCLLNRGQEL